MATNPTIFDINRTVRVASDGVNTDLTERYETTKVTFPVESSISTAKPHDYILLDIPNPDGEIDNYVFWLHANNPSTDTMAPDGTNPDGINLDARTKIRVDFDQATVNLPQITDITVLDGSKFTSTESGDYFLINSTTTSYHVWYEINNGTGPLTYDPAITNPDIRSTPIKVTIKSSSDNTIDVAVSTAAAINAEGGAGTVFSVPIPTSNTLTVTNTVNGTVEVAEDFNSEATFDVTQKGVILGENVALAFKDAVEKVGEFSAEMNGNVITVTNLHPGKILNSSSTLDVTTATITTKGDDTLPEITTITLPSELSFRTGEVEANYLVLYGASVNEKYIFWFGGTNTSTTVPSETADTHIEVLNWAGTNNLGALAAEKLKDAIDAQTPFLATFTDNVVTVTNVVDGAADDVNVDNMPQTFATITVQGFSEFQEVNVIFPAANLLNTGSVTANYITLSDDKNKFVFWFNSGSQIPPKTKSPESLVEVTYDDAITDGNTIASNFNTVVNSIKDNNGNSIFSTSYTASTNVVTVTNVSDKTVVAKPSEVMPITSSKVNNGSLISEKQSSRIEGTSTVELDSSFSQLLRQVNSLGVNVKYTNIELYGKYIKIDTTLFWFNHAGRQIAPSPLPAGVTTVIEIKVDAESSVDDLLQLLVQQKPATILATSNLNLLSISFLTAGFKTIDVSNAPQYLDPLGLAFERSTRSNVRNRTDYDSKKHININIPINGWNTGSENYANYITIDRVGKDIRPNTIRIRSDGQYKDSKDKTKFYVWFVLKYQEAKDPGQHDLTKHLLDGTTDGYPKRYGIKVLLRRGDNANDRAFIRYQLEPYFNIVNAVSDLPDRYNMVFKKPEQLEAIDEQSTIKRLRIARRLNRLIRLNPTLAVENVDISGLPTIDGAFTNTIFREGAIAGPEITTITIPGEELFNTGVVPANYLTLYTVKNGGYRFYFSGSGQTPPASKVGITNVPVTIPAGTGGTDLASNLTNAIDSQTGISATSSANVVTVTNNQNGNVKDVDLNNMPKVVNEIKTSIGLISEETVITFPAESTFNKGIDDVANYLTINSPTTQYAVWFSDSPEVSQVSIPSSFDTENIVQVQFDSSNQTGYNIAEKFAERINKDVDVAITFPMVAVVGLGVNRNQVTITNTNLGSATDIDISNMPKAISLVTQKGGSTIAEVTDITIPPGITFDTGAVPANYVVFYATTGSYAFWFKDLTSGGLQTAPTGFNNVTQVDFDETDTNGASVAAALKLDIDTLFAGIFTTSAISGSTFTVTNDVDGPVAPIDISNMPDIVNTLIEGNDPRIKPGDKIDGVTLSAEDRILLKDMEDSIKNGIYEIGANGTLIRATDFDDDTEVKSGSLIYVSEGDVNGKQRFSLTTKNPDIDISELKFSGILDAEDGSESNPIYSFRADPDTGIFHGATGELSISAAGTERLNVSSTGITVNGKVLISDGSVSEPSLTFTAHPDIGISLLQSESIIASFNGYEYVRMNGKGVEGWRQIATATTSTGGPLDLFSILPDGSFPLNGYTNYKILLECQSVASLLIRVAINGVVNTDTVYDGSRNWIGASGNPNSESQTLLNHIKLGVNTSQDYGLEINLFNFNDPTSNNRQISWTGSYDPFFSIRGAGIYNNFTGLNGIQIAGNGTWAGSAILYGYGPK